MISYIITRLGELPQQGEILQTVYDLQATIFFNYALSKDDFILSELWRPLQARLNPNLSLPNVLPFDSFMNVANWLTPIKICPVSEEDAQRIRGIPFPYIASKKRRACEANIAPEQDAERQTKRW